VKQAINAGDVMFTLAHLAIPRLTLEANLHLAYEMVRALDDACLELTRGQHLDMLFEERDEVSADEYLDMISGKTAALVATAARLGAMAGSADPGLQANYEAFGFNLGMAFQVRDDMLDIWGSPEQTGKAAAVDIYDRKKSLPVLYALERSEELRAFYRREADFDDQAVSRIIGLLDQVGAKDYARSLAESYSHGTVQYLEAASPGGDAGDALVELVEEMLKRKG
jgi:geranylgeranyl diphosphate synthase type I